MKTFKVTIKGTTPLLMNKPKEYGFDNAIKIKLPSQTSEEGRKQALEKIYSIDGVPYQPAAHILGSLSNAGKDLKIKGKGKSTYSRMFASMVQITPEAILHKKIDFDIFAVMTVNPNTRGRNMTYRPRLKEWELDFELIAEEEIPSEVIKEGLERAGKYVGIGDWRPQTKGVHGKFMVIGFKELS